MTLRWLARRLLFSVFVLFGAVTITFVVVRLTPGDPVRIMLGTANPSQAVLDQARHDFELDRPLIVQYGLFLGRLVRGNLGTSYQLHEPVTEVIGGQLGSTLALTLAAVTLALAAAILIAVATAGRWRPLRALSSAVELLLISTPPFWSGVLLLTMFSFHFHLFPVAGGDGLRGLVLPAVTLALSLVGMFAQVLREGLERALEEPFVLSARARGTGETVVRIRHGLRHALIPVVTLSGWVVGALLGGAVIVETVFSRPGIGRVLATAISDRDLPVVTGIVLVTTLVFVVVNIAVDLLYRVVDPRLGEASP